MKLNQGKCHFIPSGNKYENNVFAPNIIDRNLNFNDYVTYFHMKKKKKPSVLDRLSYYMSIKQRRILLKTFIDIESQFHKLFA